MNLWDEPVDELDDVIMEDLMGHEDFRAHPYVDTTGNLTVGYGHRILPGEDYTSGISQEEGINLLRRDYETHRSAAEKVPGWNEASDPQKRAITNLTYNMGPNWWRSWDETPAAMAEGNWGLAADNLRESKWYRDVGENRGDEVLSWLSGGERPRPKGQLASAGEDPTLQGRVPRPTTSIHQDQYRRMTLPDETTVDIPPGMDFNEAWEKARKKFPDAFASRESKEDTTPLDMFTASFYGTISRLKPGVETAVADFIEDEGWYDAGQQKLIKASEEAHKLAPNPVALEDISKAYNKDGLYAGIAKAFELAGEQIAGSAGFVGPAVIAGTVVGAVAGSILGPGGTVAGSVVGAKTIGMLAYTGLQIANYMAGNLERAYAEGAKDTKDLNLGKVMAASLGQAGLEAVTARLAGGFKFLNRNEKSATLGAVGRWIDDLDQQAGVKKFLAIVVEEDTAEVAQQGFERWAVGLPISPANEDAMREYGQVALMSLAPSAGFAFGGMGTGKWNQRKQLRYEQGLQSERDSLETLVRVISKNADEFKGHQVEESSKNLAEERRANADRRAELELQIQSDRFGEAGSPDALIPRSELKARAEAELNSLREEAASIDRRRSEEAQRILASNQVSTEDIHNIANEKNILWDDDPAFIAFVMRQLGKPKLDMLDANDRVELYKIIADMPKQPHPTPLEIAPNESAIEFARTLRGKVAFKGMGEGVLDSGLLLDFLGIDRKDISDPTIESIVDAYRRKMVELGLMKIRTRKGKREGTLAPMFELDKEGNPKLPTFSRKDKTKFTVSKEDYDAYLNYIREEILKYRRAKAAGADAGEEPLSGFVTGEGADLHLSPLIYDPTVDWGSTFTLSPFGFDWQKSNFATYDPEDKTTEINDPEGLRRRDALEKLLGGSVTADRVARLNAFAILNGDVVKPTGHPNSPWVLAGQDFSKLEKPAFRIVVDGEAQPGFFRTMADAQRAAVDQYDVGETEVVDTDEGRFERSQTLSHRYKGPFDAPEKYPGAREVVIEQVDAPKHFGAFDRVEYEVNSKKTRAYRITDQNGETVRVETDEKVADRWVRSHERGRERFDLAIREKGVPEEDWEVISTHVSERDATDARKYWASERTRKRFEERGEGFEDWRDREGAARRIEARESLAIVPRPIEGPSYNVERVNGYVVKEFRVRGDTKDKFRPVAIYESLEEAQDKIARLEGEKEWKESVGGRLTETEEESADVRAAREIAVAEVAEKLDRELPRVDVPESVEAMEESLKEREPAREPIESILDRDIPRLVETEIVVDELTPKQQTLVDELLKLAKSGLRHQGYNAFKLEFVKALDEKGSFANFDHATNTIRIAMRPELIDADLAQARMFLAPLIRHETVHGLRRLGAFKPSEWKSLAKFVAKRKIAPARLAEFNAEMVDAGLDPLPEGSTYLDLAKARYAEEGELSKWIADDYVEEAVAQAFGDWSVNRKVAPGQPGGLFSRIVNIFRSLGSALRKGAFTNAEEIFENIYTGKKFAQRLNSGKVKDLWYSRRPEELRVLRESIDQRRAELAGQMIEREAAGLGIEGISAADSKAIVARLGRDKDAVEEGVNTGPVRARDVHKKDPYTGEPVDKKLSIRERLKQRYKFKGDIPADANERVARTYKSKLKEEFFGQLAFNRRGKALKNPRAMVYVPKGYREEGDRGYGEAALDAWNPAIAMDTQFHNWQELLGGFFQELNTKADASRPNNVHFLPPEFGRVTAIWNDPDFRNPVTVVFDLDEESKNGDYFVVAARPSASLVQPPGSAVERDGSPRIWGKDATASAVMAALGTDAEYRATESQMRRMALMPPEGGAVAGEGEGLEGTLWPSHSNGQTLWKTMMRGAWDYGVKKGFEKGWLENPRWDERFYALDRMRKGFFDHFHKIYREELLDRGERMERGADAFLENLAVASTQSALFDYKNARKYLMASMEHGYPIDLDGVVMVGGYKKDIDGNILKEGYGDMDSSDPKWKDRIWTGEGRPELTEENELINKVRVRLPEGVTNNIDGRELRDGDTFSRPVYTKEEGNNTGGMHTILLAASTPSNNFIDSLYGFLHARRGHRLLKEGHAIPSALEEKLPELLKLPEKYPEILVIAENYERWNDGILEFAIQGGYISQEAAEHYRRYHDFIPFYPELDKDDLPFKESSLKYIPGLAGVQELPPYDGFKKRTLDTPVEAMMKNAFFMIESSLRTRALNKTIINGLDRGTIIEDPDPSKKSLHRVTTWVHGKKTHFLVEDPMLVETMTGMLEGNDPYMGGGKLAIPARWTREMVTRGINFIFRNPMRDSVEVAMTNGGITPFFTPLKNISQNLGHMYRIWRGQKSEPRHSFVMLERHGKATRYEHAGGAMKDLLPVGSAANKLIGEMDRGKAKWGRGSGSRALKSWYRLWDAMGEASMYSEMAVRERVYENEVLETLQPLLDRGYSQKAAERIASAEGARQAEETMNFNRSGDNKYLRMLTSHTAFFNARLQGFDRFMRIGLAGGEMFGGEGPGLHVIKTKGKGRATAGTAMKVTLAMAQRGAYVSALSAIMGMWNNDDDDYRKIRPEKRVTEWAVKIPGDSIFQFITLPGGFETNLFFKVIPEVIAVAFQDRLKHGDVDGRALTLHLTEGVRQAIPVAELPQFIRWPSSLLANFNFFTRSPIIPHYKEGLGARDATQSTGPAARAWADLVETTGIVGPTSALKTQFVFDDMLLPGGHGDLWQTVANTVVSLTSNVIAVPAAALGFKTPTYDMIAPTVNSIPGVGVFLHDKYGAGARSEFYDGMDQMLLLQKKANLLENEDPAAAVEFMREHERAFEEKPGMLAVRRKLKKLRDEKKRIRSSDMGYFEKRSMLNKVERQESVVHRLVPEMLRRSDLPLHGVWDIF